jgi:predicted HTH transcriptional regulator
MLAVFTKPIELVTAADIAELPAETWPEGYEVEFKKTLPDKRGGGHPWLGGGDIGDHARDEILSEVIAFANAQGGSVVLGIEKTSDKPPPAHAVTPLPRVGELARRFEDQARSCIDHPLPRLQIRAIETDGQDRGVVVFRTSASQGTPRPFPRMGEKPKTGGSLSGHSTTARRFTRSGSSLRQAGPFPASPEVHGYCWRPICHIANPDYACE